MKLWRDNKIDAEWELANEEIAQRFWESSWGQLQEQERRRRARRETAMAMAVVAVCIAVAVASALTGWGF